MTASMNAVCLDPYIVVSLGHFCQARTDGSAPRVNIVQQSVWWMHYCNRAVFLVS